MKSCGRYLIVVLWATVVFAAASPQVERLMEPPKDQGETFAEAFYWLPETGQPFGKPMADLKDRVGFEPGRWQLVPEATKAAVFKDIGEAFDKLNRAQFERSWKLRAASRQTATAPAGPSPGSLEEHRQRRPENRHQ